MPFAFHPPVLHLDALDLKEHVHGDRYQARMASFAAPLGATMLGGRLVVVPPGKRAWPFHGHHANEELFVILSGTGRLRYADGDHGLRAGDVALCPAGGAASAHQIVNDGDVDLRYLAISTMNAPDVLDYPDSGKFAVMAGTAPGGDKTGRTVDHVGRYADAVGYWDDEP
ncbi:cupin domain-containing protein [Sphingosinithalassobacter portus]|uniref:cupin domain-containing protein n=1 Tax=Stakelama portus TaxID=2676234 RepID=UPI000D6E79E0|nr:cupin domain-containing protein [Sphingosinithalassobacter portus]